jgi:sporulation protein YlmC with PRC-barrel domain
LLHQYATVVVECTTKTLTKPEGSSMKKAVAGLAALVFAAPLLASAQTTRPADRPVRDTRDTKAPAWKHAGLHESKDIIGTRIKSTAGKDLGEIDQLLIDRNGKVSHVVIGLGGLAGVGEKKVVVPWSDLKFAPVAEGKKNAVTMDEARLENAPRYDRTARSGESAPAASPRLNSPMKDSDHDGKSDRTDRAPLDSSKK